MAWALKISSALILPLLSHVALAQQDSNSIATRSILVNVYDQRGKPVRDLSNDNFRVRLNGKPVAVLDARYTVAPRRIVLLLDVSGSMTQESNQQKWGIAREAVEDLLAETPLSVPTAMLTFSSQSRNVIDFDQGRPAIMALLKEGPGKPLKPPANKTALFDAILGGLKLLKPFQSGDVVYAITDGRDNASQASVAHVKMDLLGSGVRVFTFIFAEPSAAPGERNSELDLVDLVDSSGGYRFGIAGRTLFGTSSEIQYLDDESSREKLRAYTKLASAQIHGFWTLALAAPMMNKSGKIALNVVEPRRVRRNLEVTYPHLLPATP